MLLLLLACTGGDKDSAPADTSDSATTSGGPGTLALTFRMDDDYIPTMEKAGEEPVGTFEGSIYAEADANELGPVDGAVALVDFSVELNLLPDGGPTDVLYTTDPLDPQIVWVLGCLNSDANEKCGDPGDPITRPTENKFQVVADTETTVEVYMGMLRP
jgi:hypothetical protein